MATTTFTGPVTAGSVLDTTGNTPGTIKNVGGVVLGQTAPVTQSASGVATSIVIPAGSTIQAIYLGATAAWNGTASTFTVGISATANELGSGTGGVTPVATASVSGAALWLNVGATDVIVYIKSANAGAGVGFLTVQYLQGPNNIS